MKKTSVKHLLSLCIILLSGLIYLGAQSCQDGAQYSSTRILEPLELASAAQNLQASVVKKASSGPKAENYKREISVIENEEETDKYISFKENAGHFIKISNPPVLEYFYKYIKSCLPTFKRYPFTSNKSYILFRVFRI